MKKLVFVLLAILVAGVVFGQEFTFQGLPWGFYKRTGYRKARSSFFTLANQQYK